MYYQLTVFDGGNYATYEEALKSGAVYTTPSTIDCITFESNNSKTGMFDLDEVIQAIKKCLGNESLVVGIVHETKGFIDFQELLIADFVDYDHICN